MDVDRHTAAVIQHGYRAILMDGDENIVRMASECFVDRVIHDLEHHVVEA